MPSASAVMSTMLRRDMHGDPWTPSQQKESELATPDSTAVLKLFDLLQPIQLKVALVDLQAVFNPFALRFLHKTPPFTNSYQPDAVIFLLPFPAPPIHAPSNDVCTTVSWGSSELMCVPGNLRRTGFEHDICPGSQERKCTCLLCVKGNAPVISF